MAFSLFPIYLFFNQSGNPVNNPKMNHALTTKFDIKPAHVEWIKSHIVDARQRSASVDDVRWRMGGRTDGWRSRERLGRRNGFDTRSRPRPVTADGNSIRPLIISPAIITAGLEHVTHALKFRS